MKLLKRGIFALMCSAVLLAGSGCSPKTLDTLEYTGIAAFETPDIAALRKNAGDNFATYDGISGDLLEDIKIKAPLAVYLIPDEGSDGSFIAPGGLDIADSLFEAETIVVIEGKPYDYYFLDKNMVYCHMGNSSNITNLNNCLKRIKEDNDISRDNPNTLAFLARQRSKILDGSFVSMLDSINNYPQNLNLEENPALLSGEDMAALPMFLTYYPDGDGCFSETWYYHNADGSFSGHDDPVGNDKPKSVLKCRLLNPFNDWKSDIVVFAEQVGHVNLGTYGFFTLSSPVYRFSVIDLETGSLIAWRNVYLEEGPESSTQPNQAKDGRYYGSIDAWDLFVKSLSD
jgi:hypothetical protein